MRCYVASPLGFFAAGREWNERVLLPAIASAGLTPVDPWALVPAGGPSPSPLEIGRANAEAIRGCAVLAAVLDGQEVDSGTAAEVGYAAALGIPCFGLRTDLRQSGEDGVAVNLQVEWFIAESGGRMTATLEALVSALQASLIP